VFVPVLSDSMPLFTLLLALSPHAAAAGMKPIPCARRAVGAEAATQMHPRRTT